MKQILKLATLCLVLAVLLCACSLPDRVFTCKNLSITLPGSFADLSSTLDGDDLDFFYMTAKTGITGYRVEKASMTEDAESLTPENFVELMQYSNAHTGKVTHRGDICSYIYTAETDGEDFTYLVAVFDAEDALWVLQCYCRTAEFSKTEETFWSYLETVTFSENN